ncbi:hypothetical protein SUDANB105_03784 [Streptomyces sp. enrichment culture]|uniref:hypothetical protein n=1 Tax=Streptomyces sp. enrichment culture TaxID=1795815 RepID=UPI003F574F5D
MPRRWSLGLDRLHYEAIDGDYDRLKKTAKAHELHDGDRKMPLSGRSGPSKGLSGPSSNDANTPKKRRWGR